MQQWRDAKSRHRDSLLFFRVGDFYELFHSDAEEGSRLLGLTLTSRNNGAAAKVPLAGVPAKALEDYLARLVRLGRGVAICDQVEDPADAKGIVRREVTEIVTPGTVLADGLLSERRNNFVVAVVQSPDAAFAIAVLDVSTGELSAQRVAASELRAELGRLEPAELLLPRSLEGVREIDAAAPSTAIARTYRDDWMFEIDVSTDELLRVYSVQSLDGLGVQSGDTALVRAAGGLIQYLREIRPSGVTHLKPLRLRRPGSVMLLDEMTRRNLELIEPLRSGEDGGTLLNVIDLSVTAMGGRLLRRWILEPLVVAQEIWSRQAAVQELVERPEKRDRVRTALAGVTDLERLAGKIGTGRVGPRDLHGLRRSLERLPDVRETGEGLEADMTQSLTGGLDCMEEVLELLREAIADEPPATLQEGGVIRSGWSAQLDDVRAVRDGARDFIASLQARERERTGISTLKVGFNRVFGYYLEVTKTNLAKVPDDYVRKQTLTNGERYFTPELKEWEEKVFGAEDRIGQLETELFSDVRARVSGAVFRLQDLAARVAALDVLACFAEVAIRRGYVRPEVHTAST